MIATVTADKFVDGTPLYRMEDVLGRANIPVGRGTPANWIIRPAELHYSSGIASCFYVPIADRKRSPL